MAAIHVTSEIEWSYDKRENNTIIKKKYPADVHYILVHISGLLWCADFHKLGFFSQKNNGTHGR